MKVNVKVVPNDIFKFGGERVNETAVVKWMHNSIATQFLFMYLCVAAAK